MAAIQPYIGGGVGVFAWRYSETGEFVDFTRLQHFPRQLLRQRRAQLDRSCLAASVFPVGSWSIGGEIRYQSAQGELPDDQGFSGTKIDLGGFNYLATFKVQF